MTELSLARFQALADAYGGTVARWPEADRIAATAMATSKDARAILAEAVRLDETLDAWRVAAPAAVLRDRIAAHAPAPRPALALRARLWWSGIGVTAALAGAVAGMAAVAFVAPVDTPLSASTSFGDVAPQEG